MREPIPNSPKGREHILNSYLMAPFLVSMALLGINWRPRPSAHGKEDGKTPQGSHRDRNKQWLLSLHLQQSEKTQILPYFLGKSAGNQSLPLANNPSRLLGTGRTSWSGSVAFSRAWKGSAIQKNPPSATGAGIPRNAAICELQCPWKCEIPSPCDPRAHSIPRARVWLSLGLPGPGKKGIWGPRQEERHEGRDLSIEN